MKPRTVIILESYLIVFYIQYNFFEINDRLASIAELHFILVIVSAH